MHALIRELCSLGVWLQGQRVLISIPGGASGSYWMSVGVSLHPFLRCMNLSGKGTLQLICTTPRSAFSQYFVGRRSDIS